MVGCAPDTFLGGGMQTCRKLIDDGWIGRPVAATAFMAGHGVETWHPNPFFYYQPGGGPVLDMGPYYLTALVTLLGPARRVTASTGISFAERTATTKELYGQKDKSRGFDPRGGRDRLRQRRDCYPAVQLRRVGPPSAAY